MPTTQCTEYAAAQNYTPDVNWTCVGDWLTVTQNGGETAITNVATGRSESISDKPDAAVEAIIQEEDSKTEQAADPQMSPRAVKDLFHASNNQEFIIWNIDGKRGAVTFSFNISLHNHSGNVAMGWWETTGTPVEVQYRLRIREDKGGQLDSTIFDYENSDNYNDGYPEIYATHVEQYFDQGYDVLPYPASPKRYFWDAHKAFLATETSSWVSAWGSVQSDRVTCQAGELCKFLG
ncbi:hypothetical protein P9990_25260 (plasmid) [Prescottella equi]|uniref:hypothetical protein n=1 Tax=Rhodococcus hoagii TaxID=43767 RepID=UPI0025767F07|nr:hypothetical protein [Prescottella equi]WJJ14505.1 hypothetical protein P9990_25260 [Prescottella equi]